MRDWNNWLVMSAFLNRSGTPTFENFLLLPLNLFLSYMLHLVWALIWTAVHLPFVCRTAWTSPQLKSAFSIKTLAYCISFINFVRWPQILSNYLQSNCKTFPTAGGTSNQGELENDSSQCISVNSENVPLMWWYSPQRSLRTTRVNNVA